MICSVCENSLTACYYIHDVSWLCHNPLCDASFINNRFHYSNTVALKNYDLQSYLIFIPTDHTSIYLTVSSDKNENLTQVFKCVKETIRPIDLIKVSGFIPCDTNNLLNSAKTLYNQLTKLKAFT